MTQQQDPQVTEPVVPAKARGFFGLPWLARVGIVIGVFAGLVIVGRGASPTPTTTAGSPSPRYLPPASQTAGPTVAAPLAPRITFGDGFYEVGRDVAAGTFVAPGGRNCFWARERDATGHSTIANEWSPGQGQVIVTAKAGEYLKVSDCGTWTKR